MLSDDDVFLLKQNKADKISAVVCCKNREYNLLRAIDSWLMIKEISEIIVLDYGSDKKIQVQNDETKIKIFRYEADNWHLTKAYNIAMQLASNEILLKLDSDYILSRNFIKYHPMKNNFFYRGSGSSTMGLVMVYRNDFLKVNGYNERIINWGYDDNDLYTRLMLNGVAPLKIDKNSVKHLPHDDNSRISNQPDPKISLSASRNLNKQIAKKQPWSLRDKISTIND